MNQFEVLRIGSAQQLDYPVTDVPTPESVTIAKAYWTLKESLGDSDAKALVALEITTSPDAMGWISDDGANDGRGLLKFLVSSSDLYALDPAKTYFRTIKVILSNGQASCPRDPDAPVRILSAGIQKVS